MSPTQKYRIRGFCTRIRPTPRIVTVTIAHVGESANRDLKGPGAVSASFGHRAKPGCAALFLASRSGFHLRVTRSLLYLLVRAT
jgi:hypothetical protein